MAAGSPEAQGKHPINEQRTAWAISTVLILLLLGSGTMYGYNALRPVLIKDGAYSELCSDSSKDMNSYQGSIDTEIVDYLGCAEQRLSLNLAETLSFVLSDIAYLPGGLLMDYIGIRSLSWVLALFYLLGFGLLSLASYAKVGSLYLISLLILGGVPSCTYIAGLGSAKMLSNVQYTHWVSSGVSLCYEVSPMFMYLLRQWVPKYMSLGLTMGIAAAVTTFLCAFMGFVHITRKEARDIDTYHGATSRTDNKIDSNELYNHLIHPRYVLQTIFMTVVNTKNQFYVATFADQIAYFSTREEGEFSNHLFDVGFFLSPIIATPFVIIFLGRFRDCYEGVFMWLWAMTMSHAVLNTWGKESLTCQLAAMVIFFILKPLKWASSAEFIHQAPYKLSMYGRLFGIESVICALGAAFIYPLTKMSYEYFDGCFFYANLILTACEASVVTFPLYLYFENRYNWQKAYTSPKKQELECLLPDAATGGNSKYLASDGHTSNEGKVEVSHGGVKHRPLFISR